LKYLPSGYNKKGEEEEIYKRFFLASPLRN